MKKCLHLIISGTVQGVYYRASTQNQAQSLDLKGWVRNLNNGNVEVTAYGEEENLKKLLDWCHQGPKFSKVESIQVNWMEEKSDFKGFIIEKTR